MKYVFIYLLASLLFGHLSSKKTERVLGIGPVYQRTPLWCWVSCGEMVFKYYDICSINPGNDYQCGIIALLGPQCNANCYSCPVPAGSTQRIINMLNQYPRVARNVCGSGRSTITCKDVLGAVDESDIMEDIDEGMPILAGVNPAGGDAVGFESQHACLIIGYEMSGNDEMSLIVNDPFPYDRMGVPNPYIRESGTRLQEGQYLIGYSAFANGFAWNRTLRSIH